MPRRDLLKAGMARSRHNDETHSSHNRPSPSSFDSANLVIQMQLGQPNVILFDEPTASVDLACGVRRANDRLALIGADRLRRIPLWVTYPSVTFLSATANAWSESCSHISHLFASRPTKKKDRDRQRFLLPVPVRTRTRARPGNPLAQL
jgi:dihydrodipicolinate synthase/N-acetylneuraminate lyase